MVYTTLNKRDKMIMQLAAVFLGFGDDFGCKLESNTVEKGNLSSDAQ